MIPTPPAAMIAGMEFVAILFLLVMLGIAGLAALVFWLATGFWGVLAFAGLLLIGLWMINRPHIGPRPIMRRDTLNAFQQPLANDRDQRD